MNHTTLAIVAIIVAATLAAGVLAISSTQAAYADRSETNFLFKQKQKNVCSGFADCQNDAQIEFDPHINSNGQEDATTAATR